MGGEGFFKEVEFVLLAVINLVFELTGERDELAALGSGVNKDVGMEVIGVVMKAIGVPQRVAFVELIGKVPHGPFHALVKDSLRVDSLGNEFVVEFLRHRKDEPVVILFRFWESVGVDFPRAEDASSFFLVG